MSNIFIIDFGTTRTKAAYLNASTGRVELFRMGVDEKPYIPSLFYLGSDGRRLYGDQAHDQLADDPLGLLTTPLKSNLREPVVRTGNRQKAKPAELIGQLISGILNQAESIQHVDAKELDQLILTIPVHFAAPDIQILKEAASLANIREDQLSFVKEPISAAWAWMSETTEEMDHIVVVDGGGGTLDWACLLRNEDGELELVADPPPGGDNNLGGYHIDLNLFELLQDKVAESADDLSDLLLKERAAVLDQIKNIKERYARSGGVGVVRFHGKAFTFTKEEIDGVMQERYITQFCEQIAPFLKNIQDKLEIEKPKVLLVGGSSQIPGLASAIMERVPCEVLSWDKGIFATVLGQNGVTEVNGDKRRGPNLFPDDFNKQFEAGEKSYESGDYKQAIEHFATCIQINPNSDEAFAWRGQAFAEIEDLERALEDLSVAIDLNPIKIKYYYYRAFLYAVLDNEQLAETNINSALSIEPNTEDDFSYRGLINSGLEDYHGAIHDYSQAIDLNPYNDVYFNMRGLAKHNLKDYHGAIHDYSQAINLNSNKDFYFGNRGIAKLNIEDYHGAISDYSRAIELNPQCDDYLNYRGVSKYNLKNYHGAISDHSRAIELNPSSDVYFNNRGLAKVGLDDYQRAISDYTRAIELNPNNDAIFYNRGDARLLIEDYHGAISDYTRAIELNSINDLYLFMRGVAKNNLQEYNDAINDYSRAIELNPSNDAYYNMRGNIKLGLEDYYGAVGDYTRAIELNPNNDVYFSNRAYVKMYILGNTQGAIRDYSKAVELNPYDESHRKKLNSAKNANGDNGFWNSFLGD